MALVPLEFLDALNFAVLIISVFGWTEYCNVMYTDQYFKRVLERLFHDASVICNTDITPYCVWRETIDTEYWQQSIPAEDLDIYLASLQEQKNDGTIRVKQPENVGNIPSQFQDIMIVDGIGGQTVWRKIFRDTAAAWTALSPEEKDWWKEQAEPEEVTGYQWYLHCTLP